MVQTPNDSVCHSASSVSSGAVERPVLKQLFSSHCFVLRQHLLGFTAAASCLTGALDSDLDDSCQTRKNTNWPPPRTIRLAQKIERFEKYCWSAS